MAIRSHAAVMFEAGAPLELTEIDVDSPKANEVLVRVAATGVCRSDYNSFIDDRTPLPSILGHEGAGFVEAVGPGVESVRAGDYVALSWLPYCGTCPHCHRKQTYLCEEPYQALFDGTLLDGTVRFRHNDRPVNHYSVLSTFSNYTVVPAASCVKVDSKIPVGVAAMMGCGVLTGYGAAVHAGAVAEGKSVAILGLGGVGCSALMGALAKKVSVILGVDFREANRRTAESFGCDQTSAPGAEALDVAKTELTGKVGFDVVIDTTGSVKAARQGLELLRRGGRLVCVGAYHDEELSFTAPGFHRMGREIVGSFYGSIDPILGFDEVSRLYLDGKLPLDRLVRDNQPFSEMAHSMKPFEDLEAPSWGRTIYHFE